MIGTKQSTSRRSVIRTNSNFAPRSAFTLLETMLALTLSALLLGAIYAAIDQSWKLTSSGHQEMERLQLARALIHTIEIDIRAITYTPPPPVAPGEEGATQAAAPAAQPANGAAATATTTATETPVPNSKSIGIRGTNQKMEMSIVRPRRDLLPGTSAVVIQSGTSDLRSVSYSFMAAGGSVSGLVRTEGDRMAVEVIEASGSAATKIENIQVLAPEVMAAHFRYFDGKVWAETWDSDTVGRIPRAVEVLLAIAPAKHRSASFGGSVNQSMETFRTVIVIPVSDPFPKELLP